MKNITHTNTSTQNNPKSPMKKKSAFTLIELLIAVGIIAIIVAIAIPALSTSKGDADRQSAEARAKVLNEARDRAILLDLQVNGTNLTSITEWTACFPNSNSSTNAISFLLQNGLIQFNAN
jgi:prepilin-type N-terminal cleavage/methylation domain-containing protein